MQTIANPETPHTDAASVFRLLADETRLRTLLLLERCGELCVCELTATLAVSQPKMSRHLAMLRDGGLVDTRRSGQWVHYRLSSALPAWSSATITHTAAGLITDTPFAQDIERVRRAIAKNRSGCES